MSVTINSSYEQTLGQWLVKIIGEVDISNATQLKDELEKDYKEHETDIIVDISDMHYIDSSGLGVIIGVYGNIRGAGHRIVLVSPRDNVKKLLRVTSLDTVLC